MTMMRSLTRDGKRLEIATRLEDLTPFVGDARP